ncbi:MAG: hypothetical protein ACKO8Q_07160 [Bacteroidota bacterium]
MQKQLVVRLKSRLELTSFPNEVSLNGTTDLSRDCISKGLGKFPYVIVRNLLTIFKQTYYFKEIEIRLSTSIP